MRRTAFPWRLLGLASVACFAAVSLRPAFSHAVDRMTAAASHRAESAEAGRRRCLGAAFVQRADQLRRELAPAEPYYLVEGDDPKHGGALMVRFELAPRPAVFLGPFSRLGDPARLRREISSARILPVVVAFRPGRPPFGWQRFELLAEVERRAAARGRAGAAPPPARSPGARLRPRP